GVAGLQQHVQLQVPATGHLVVVEPPWLGLAVRRAQHRDLLAFRVLPEPARKRDQLHHIERRREDVGTRLRDGARDEHLAAPELYLDRGGLPGSVGTQETIESA